MKEKECLQAFLFFCLIVSSLNVIARNEAIPAHANQPTLLVTIKFNHFASLPQNAEIASSYLLAMT